MVGSCDKLFTDPPDIPHCRYCGFKTRYDYTNPLFKLSKKTMDISYTYDGACIVSEKWKSFCIENDFSNVSFVPLKLDLLQHLHAVWCIFYATDFIFIV